MKTKVVINQNDIIDLVEDQRFKDLLIEKIGLNKKADFELSFESSNNDESSAEDPLKDVPEDPEIEKMDHSTSKYLLKKSGIVNLLKKALKNIGKESRFPSNAEEICLKSIEHILSSKKNKKTFEDFIKDPNFILFSNIWQDIHTDIEKSICE